MGSSQVDYSDYIKQIPWVVLDLIDSADSDLEILDEFKSFVDFVYSSGVNKDNILDIFGDLSEIYFVTNDFKYKFSA